MFRTQKNTSSDFIQNIIMTLEYKLKEMKINCQMKHFFACTESIEGTFFPKTTGRSVIPHSNKIRIVRNSKIEITAMFSNFICNVFI